MGINKTPSVIHHKHKTHQGIQLNEIKNSGFLKQYFMTKFII